MRRLIINPNRLMTCRVVLLSVIFYLFAVVFGNDVWAQSGNTYYVDKDSIGGTCSDDNPGTITQPWQTISKANQELQAGDTVFIRSGEYNETIAPGNNGAEQNRITYTNYQDESVTLCNVSDAIRMISRSYITIDNIDCGEVDRYILIDSCHHICFQNCRFDNAVSEGGWPIGVRFRYNSHHNRIHHCSIGRVGYCTSTDDKGGVINIGTWSDTSDKSDYNLIEDNTFFYGGHHVMTISSNYNVIRNNYFHNENWMDCERSETGKKCGNRNIIFEYDGTNVRWNLVENNRIAFSGVPPDNNTSSGLSLRTPHNIVRRNLFYNCDGPGMGFSTLTGLWDASNNYFYHNVCYHNGYTALPGVEEWKQAGLLIAHHGSGAIITDLSIKNNIFYDNKTHSIKFYYVDPDEQILEGNWEKDYDPGFVDIESPQDPFDPSLPDFNLKPESSCIDSGVYLTRITSPDNSGTKFHVEDAGYFTHGWGIIEGDMIQLEGGTQRVQILDIDYDNNIITVDSNLTWIQNTGVSLVYEGSSPDIGVYEYKDTTSAVNFNYQPENITLLQNHPNPFSELTIINYELRIAGEVCLKVYDVFGNEVRTLVNENKSAGYHSVVWDGKDDLGEGIGSGIYFFNIKTGNQLSQTKNLLLIK